MTRTCTGGVARGRRGWRDAIDRGEVVGLVATALACNAFAYGAVLYLHGSTDLLTLSLLVGGGFLGLVAAGWLVVVYEIQALISA